MDNLSLPSPVVILRQLQEVEKDLLATELPVEVGPLLLRRHNLIYTLVVCYLWGNIKNAEADAVIQSDVLAQQILKELTNALQKTPDGETNASGSLDLAPGGILSRIGKPLE